jgi:hypothetical protein
MPAKKRASIKKAGGSKDDAAVAEFLRDLDHPLKKEIEDVRRIILGVSPAIGEGIKWNSLSFRTTEYFATVFLRSTDRVQLIFHLGAKAKDNSKKLKIADPAGLIKWLSTDRGLVTVGAPEEIAVNRGALESIVWEWIRHL